MLTLLLPGSGGVGHAEVTTLPLRDNVGIRDIAGGEGTNLLWKSEPGSEEFRRALRRSLDAAGLLERAKGEGTYSLNAVLERVEESDLGSSVTICVKYTLIDKSCGREVYQESILSEYTMQVWDSLLKPRKSQRALETATRINTGILAEKLLHMSLFQDRVSLSQ